MVGNTSTETNRLFVSLFWIYDGCWFQTPPFVIKLIRDRTSTKTSKLNLTESSWIFVRSQTQHGRTFHLLREFSSLHLFGTKGNSLSVVEMNWEMFVGLRIGCLNLLRSETFLPWCETKLLLIVTLLPYCRSDAKLLVWCFRFLHLTFPLKISSEAAPRCRMNEGFTSRSIQIECFTWTTWKFTGQMTVNGFKHIHI